MNEELLMILVYLAHRPNAVKFDQHSNRWHLDYEAIRDAEVVAQYLAENWEKQSTDV